MILIASANEGRLSTASLNIATRQDLRIIHSVSLFVNGVNLDQVLCFFVSWYLRRSQARSKEPNGNVWA